MPILNYDAWLAGQASQQAANAVTQVAGVQTQVTNLNTAVQLLNNELTPQVQAVLDQLVASGVSVIKDYKSSTVANGNNTLFDAPTDFTVGASVGFIIVDNKSYKIVDSAVYAASTDLVATIVTNSGVKQAQFKQAPMPSMDATTGAMIATNPYWVYSIRVS